MRVLDEVWAEEDTAEVQRTREAVRAFYKACQDDPALSTSVNHYALAAPLSWGACLLDVDSLAVTSLRWLLEALNLAIEDCVHTQRLTARCIDALDQQQLPSAAMHQTEFACFCRSLYWRALVTVVQHVEAVNLDEPPTALQLIPRARAIVQHPATASRLEALQELRRAGNAHHFYFPGPLRMYRRNDIGNACLYEPIGPLGPRVQPAQLDQLIAGAREAIAAYAVALGEPRQATEARQQAREAAMKAWGAAMHPLIFVSRAMLELISPSIEEDMVLQVASHHPNPRFPTGPRQGL